MRKSFEQTMLTLEERHNDMNGYVRATNALIPGGSYRTGSQSTKTKANTFEQDANAMHILIIKDLGKIRRYVTKLKRRIKELENN